MMPTSVLRMWFSGLLGWAVLGAGIYLLYEWSDGVDPAVQTQRVRDIDTGRLEMREVRVPPDQRDTQGGTSYLAWGLALTIFSFAGCLPTLLFMGRPRFDEPGPLRNGEQREVTGPSGAKIHVEIHGANNRPTLLLTHGWGLDSSDWYYVQKHLSHRFRIVVWDLPGLGQSERARDSDYSIENMARALDAVVNATADGPLILVGHSIGGMILQTYCRLFPHYSQKVRGIVLVHTTYTNPLRTALGAPLWTALQRPLIDPLNYLTIALSPLVWLSNWQSYLNGSLQISSRISSFAGKQTWGQVDYSSRLFAKASPGIVARGNLAMEKFDEQIILPSIQVPVLVVSGANDRLTKPEASHHIEQKTPRATETKLQPAGHLGHWEQHEIFIETLAEFAEKYGNFDSAQRQTSESLTKVEAPPFSVGPHGT